MEAAWANSPPEFKYAWYAWYVCSAVWCVGLGGALGGATQCGAENVPPQLAHAARVCCEVQSLVASVGGGVGAAVAASLGASVGSGVGASVGVGVGVGDGDGVGASVGVRVGSSVTVHVNVMVGTLFTTVVSFNHEPWGQQVVHCSCVVTVGQVRPLQSMVVGGGVGAAVCASVGAPVGASLGCGVGASVGASLGCGVGASVCASVDASVRHDGGIWPALFLAHPLRLVAPGLSIGLSCVHELPSHPSWHHPHGTRSHDVHGCGSVPTRAAICESSR